MKYAHQGVDGFFLETVEKVRMIQSQSELKIGSYGTHKFIQTPMESNNEFLKKTAQAFMQDEFQDLSREEIDEALMLQTDAIYQDWVEFSKASGLESIENVEMGWEMVFANEWARSADGRFL